MSDLDSAPAVIIRTPGLDARQLAAVTAVVSAVVAHGEPASEAPPEPHGGWNDRAAAVRSPLHPAPGAWRSFSA
ncbi:MULTISPECIES: acyl-CoA carboxylase epsilon subunit [unclassified Rathayibacter]|uniref:acyl-CoA carboxylase epsilon subunit n=1 Tax=unclassified Rathayibacter TaxID=2609250 RepID=UPI00188AAD90|nr:MULTISPECIES: acyl-CoA carboxylase epsilon subunit [unclassified Rathayibacter]MBF4461872.1 acyl-CoA carboxylase subunit epsilon [Rathayibacter sp. VKM Ac-2879]MBF4503285.1 acyl-CoA carboxylase subunit epsilon [Rathayibacter sp. VKM Ac-2878]